MAIVTDRRVSTPVRGKHIEQGSVQDGVSVIDAGVSQRRRHRLATAFLSKARMERVRDPYLYRTHAGSAQSGTALSNMLIDRRWHGRLHQNSLHVTDAE